MAPTDPPPAGYVRLGTLGKTYQLEGGLRFYPFGEAEADAIFKLSRVFLSGLGDSDLREVRSHGGGILVYFSRALTVEAAKALVNRTVYGPAAALPQADEDDIFVDDLLEQPVYLDGESYGRVTEVVAAGMQDLLVIVAEGREVMVPLQAPYVEVTDDGVYLTDPPEGLLEP